MTQNTDLRLVQIEKDQEALTGFEQEHGEARNNLVQMEYRLRAFETCLEQAKSDLSRLEGFSIEGLIYGLLGSKDRRLSEARERCQEIQQQYDACETELSALQHKVDELQNQIDAVGNATKEYESLIASRQAEIEAGAGEGGDERSSQLTKLTEALTAAQAAVENIQKAMAAGKAALKDLDDESRVFGLMGRCRVADSGKGLKAMMNASRNKSAKDCTSRVQGSIGRFHRQLTNAFSKLEAKPELEHFTVIRSDIHTTRTSR